MCIRKVIVVKARQKRKIIQMSGQGGNSDVTHLCVTSPMYSGQNVCQHNYEVTRGHNAMETLLEDKIKNYDTGKNL